MKPCNGSRPEISEAITNGLVAISIAYDFLLPSSLMLRDSFNRSTSISPIASEIHLAARGSVVLKNSLVAGCESIGLGVLPVAFFKLAAPLKTYYNGIAVLAIFGDGGMELRLLIQ